jgi:telomeric repeat-binding factor 2-interacting protein 1
MHTFFKYATKQLGFSYSYQYVERSIRNNKLESLEAHRAGESSKVARPVGAHTSTRKHRTAFSLEDDKILWDWMQNYEENGSAIGGNLPYQSLAEKVWAKHTLLLV